MCPGIEHVEGQCNGHDAIAVAKAIPYLEAKGYPEARPSLIPSLCTHFTRAGIEWRR